MGTRLLSTETALKRHTEGLVKLNDQLQHAGQIIEMVQKRLIDAETKIANTCREHERRTTVLKSTFNEARGKFPPGQRAQTTENYKPRLHQEEGFP